MIIQSFLIKQKLIRGPIMSFCSNNNSDGGHLLDESAAIVCRSPSKAIFFFLS